MDKVVMTTLTALSKSVEATTVSPDCKHTIAWCLGKLPPLYANYQSSYESRYADEIRRLVQTLIQQLTDDTGGGAEAYQIGSGMAERFQVLHERLNLPALILKCPPQAAVARTRTPVAKRKAK
jgi:hypothetical protein